MTITELFAIYGALVVVAIGAVTLYLLQVLKSLNRILSETELILEETRPQIERMFTDATDSTTSVREMVVKVRQMVIGMISLPDFAKGFAKQLLMGLLGGEKRGR